MSKIKAGPTKAFFVRMLTRDIELADAILDLLDNCVDGVIRELKRRQNASNNGQPYTGYWAKIVATPDRFEIWDNCGGIPQDIAEKSAFMLGRPDATRDSDIETVGMYGIGMKRAIFKLGRHGVVTSQPDSGPYRVDIPPEWLEDEPGDPEEQQQAGGQTEQRNPWLLDLVTISDRFDQNGTRIVVTDLLDGIRLQFDKDKSAFLPDLEKEIGRHYALIMDKGFSVTLNEVPIKSASLAILSPDVIGAPNANVIEPYVFTGTIDGVQVDLAVGFYRPLVTEAELDDATEVESSRENAGWTVICNDRVVLFNDKTQKTGWGTKGVTPGYHNQFISIRGIISFRSTESMKLPLNTTKRGLDTSSPIYYSALDYMRDGLKKFTSFTNHWKKREEETQEAFASLHPRKLHEIVRQVASGAFAENRKLQGTRYFAPDLPRPQTQQKQRRICFAADQTDIELVANYYFDNKEQDRADVGRRCFEESLKRAKRGQT